MTPLGTTLIHKQLRLSHTDYKDLKRGGEQGEGPDNKKMKLAEACLKEIEREEVCGEHDAPDRPDRRSVSKTEEKLECQKQVQVEDMNPKSRVDVKVS